MIDRMENNTPETQGVEKGHKSIYIAVGVIVVVVLIAWGLSMLNKPEPVATNPCAIDIRSTIYQHPATSTPLTRSQAARVLFEQFFSVYKNMPDCLDSAITDFRIVSIGLSEDRVGGFTIPIVFDLKPLDMAKSGWASTSPEARIEDGWIRGKKGVLSISQQGGLYQLVI